MSVIANLLSADDSGFETSSGTWTAGSNTTIARVTGLGVSGSAALRYTSAAAGTMQASTGRYPVQASTTYMAYGRAANVAAAAGRVVSIRIDWYNASNTLISSSTTTSPATLPNSTTYSGQIIVVATSPATATQAAVTVLVTAGITAAGQQIVIDAVGIGLPAAIVGNLLPYNTSSIEMDTSGWSPVAGSCTLGRGTGWTEGAYELVMTATGTAQVQAATGLVPVAAGQYLGYLDAWSDTALPVALDIAWADAGGAPVGTAATRTVTTTPSAWTRVTVMGTAPAGAAQARLVVRPQTTAAGQVAYVDRAYLGLPHTTTGNLLPYSTQSMELGVSDWVAASGCTIAQSAVGDPRYSGAYSMRATCAAAGGARIEMTSRVPVTPGEYYNIKVNYSPVATQASCWLDIDWYDAAGEWLGQGYPDQDVLAAPGKWTYDLIGRQAPPGAEQARVVLLPQTTVAGQVLYLDEVSLVQGVPPYLLEVHQATASVNLTLNQVAGGTVSVYRIGPDGSEQAVRWYGGDLVDVPVGSATTWVVEDYEAPLGVPVQYRYAVSGTTGTTPHVTIPAPPRSVVWLKDPGQPARNVKLLGKTVSAWKRAVDRGVYPVRGARMPVVVSDTRQSREGQIEVYTCTETEHSALHWLVDTGAVLLVQGLGLGSVYVSVGDVEDAPVSDELDDVMRIFTLPLTEVDRPVGGIQGTAGRTWQTVATGYPTWGAVSDAYTTWLGVLIGKEGT